ncbi:MAG: hypothetical protein KatS3mg115_0721 [Candidatus Poribacteria bacterium]|nr:MAG: hypothetical protein KatS3mg115_0721 [Candidatus Poribacteria bacterium]
MTPHQWTAHAERRARARGIRPEDVQLVIQTGRREYCRGALLCVIGRREVARGALRRLLGVHVVLCPKCGEVLTVYRNRSLNLREWSRTVRSRDGSTRQLNGLRLWSHHRRTCSAVVSAARTDSA